MEQYGPEFICWYILQVGTFSDMMGFACGINDHIYKKKNTFFSCRVKMYPNLGKSIRICSSQSVCQPNMMCVPAATLQRKRSLTLMRIQMRARFVIRIYSNVLIHHLSTGISVHNIQHFQIPEWLVSLLAYLAAGANVRVHAKEKQHFPPAQE